MYSTTFQRVLSNVKGMFGEKTDEKLFLYLVKEKESIFNFENSRSSGIYENCRFKQKFAFTCVHFKVRIL